MVLSWTLYFCDFSKKFLNEANKSFTSENSEKIHQSNTEVYKVGKLNSGKIAGCHYVQCC